MKVIEGKKKKKRASSKSREEAAKLHWGLVTKPICYLLWEKST